MDKDTELPEKDEVLEGAKERFKYAIETDRDWETTG